MLTKNQCGVNTGHKRGFVHKTASSPHDLLLSFKTPFFCEIDGMRVEGAPGDIILHRKGSTVIHGPISAKDAFVNDWIYFSDDDGTIESLPLPFDRILQISENAQIETLISNIMEESVRADDYSHRLISDTIYRMLTLVCRAVPTEWQEENTVLTRFKEARVHILHHYGEKWTLLKMAELTGYSVSRFCALYTEFFGISPMNDLLDTRLENAKDLLSLHAYKVGDVAEMCGFSSIHYFSGFLKERTGKSPSEY